MHTRRVGAFLVGAWLLGILMMWFVTSQNVANVDRTMLSPPAPVAKEIDGIGLDVTRQLLRFQALEANRHIVEMWGVIQLGIGGALLATSFMTAHRSRFVLLGAVLMTVCAGVTYFLLGPHMNGLERSFDFLPPAAAPRERESFHAYRVWASVLEVLKTGMGLCVAARLLFDLYGWAPDRAAGPSKSGRRRRRTATSAEQGAGEPA